MSGCAHVCVKCRGPCAEILERVYESPGVRARARGLGVPQRGAQRVLQGPQRAGGLFGGSRRPCSLGPGAGRRKRAAGSAAPLSAPLWAGSPAPLCDPRRCARGGGEGDWERREGLPPPQPAPPSGPLAGRCRPLAGAEGTAGPRAPQREGPASSPGTAYFPPPQPPTAPAFAPWQTSCCSRARPGPAAGPTTVHGYRFSQWWPRTPHLRADARLGSRLPTACGNLPRTPPAALLLGFSVSWLWALGEATSLLWSSVFLSVKWGK